PARRPGGSPLRRPDRELGRIRPGRAEVRLDPGHDIRVLRGDIVLLADVVLDVVELDWLARPEPDGLPVAGSPGLLEAPLVELPVQELAGGRLPLAEDGGHLRDTVDPRRGRYAGDLGEGGQDVPEGPDGVADRPGLDVTRPPDDHRHADAAVVQGPLEAA